MVVIFDVLDQNHKNSEDGMAKVAKMACQRDRRSNVVEAAVLVRWYKDGGTSGEHPASSLHYLHLGWPRHQLKQAMLATRLA